MTCLAAIGVAYQEVTGLFPPDDTEPVTTRYRPKWVVKHSMATHRPKRGGKMSLADSRMRPFAGVVEPQTGTDPMMESTAKPVGKRGR